MMQNNGTISIEDMKNAMQDNDQAIEMFNDFFQSMYWERLEIIRSVIPAVIRRIEKKHVSYCELYPVIGGYT